MNDRTLCLAGRHIRVVDVPGPNGIPVRSDVVSDRPCDCRPRRMSDRSILAPVSNLPRRIGERIGYRIHRAARALHLLPAVQRLARRILDRMDPTP